MPGHICVNQRARASVSLRFLIVGGSIAGLACAYALQTAGHHVIVVEKNDRKSRTGSGIASPPNMTTILQEWGLGPALSKAAVKCPLYYFYEAETGETLGKLRLSEIEELKADFLFLKYDDLYSILFNAATAAGVDIRYNSTARSLDEEAISVTLASGETLSGDALIGAGGYNSLARSIILPFEPEGKPDNHLYLTFTIPTDLMRKDEELMPLTEASDWSIWSGDGYFVNGALLRSKREYNVRLCLPAKDYHFSNIRDDWEDRRPASDFDLDLDQFEPRLRKLWNLAKEVTPSSFVDRPPFESFVSDTARIALVGEAAHPQTPNGSHNAAMAIEDAATLGNLFSRIQRRDQISRILAAYEEIRQPRCTATQICERSKNAYLSCPAGPEQRRRNTALRATLRARNRSSTSGNSSASNRRMTEVDQCLRVTKELWEQELVVFSHDANEAVDDWWTKWGSLLEGQSDEDLDTSVPIARSLSISVSATAS